MNTYHAGNCDIAVIGAGHAGIEAALAAARMGLRTIIFTINLDAVGNMPCNPAIGGSWTHWAVRWDLRQTPPASSTGCSIVARAPRSIPSGPRATAAGTRNI